MQHVLIIKDFRLSLTLTTSSTMSFTVKSGTTFPIERGWATISSCAFEIQVNPFTTFPSDVFEIVDLCAIGGVDHA